MERNKILILALAALVVVVIVSSSLTGGAIWNTGKGKVYPQCNDNIDNDGDGYCDFGGCTIKVDRVKVYYSPDPDCDSMEDNDEYPGCIPSNEVCDGRDNDCDGQIDENLVQQCGVTNVGVCEFGTQSCSNGNWGTCQGNIDPSPEVCEGLLDEDCDGVVDDGCTCTNGQTQTCGSDVGECQTGTQTCVGGKWSACVGEVGPTTEICDNKDNDCDGGIDEGMTCNSCTDSDGGWNIWLQGTVYGVSGGNPYNSTDYCQTGTILIEQYCSGTTPQTTQYDCSLAQNATINGTSTYCMNGACTY